MDGEHSIDACFCREQGGERNALGDCSGDAARTAEEDGDLCLFHGREEATTKAKRGGTCGAAVTVHPGR